MATNKFKAVWLLSILGAIICLTFLILLIYTFSVPKQYMTNSVEDYGKYIGNYDNKSVQEFISSFFPEEIENSFSNVTYSYRAQKNDTYAFEAYLAFTIKDSNEYSSFVEKHTIGMNQSEFRYDGMYQEFTLVDEFLPSSQKNSKTGINIRYAKIGKILCCLENQEIIFVALGVYDGGVAKTDFLTVYFDRFKIDPWEYAEHAIPSYLAYSTGDGFLVSAETNQIDPK